MCGHVHLRVCTDAAPFQGPGGWGTAMWEHTHVPHVDVHYGDDETADYASVGAVAAPAKERAACMHCIAAAGNPPPPSPAGRAPRRSLKTAASTTRPKPSTTSSRQRWVMPACQCEADCGAPVGRSAARAPQQGRCPGPVGCPPSGGPGPSEQRVVLDQATTPDATVASAACKLLVPWGSRARALMTDESCAPRPVPAAAAGGNS